MKNIRLLCLIPIALFGYLSPACSESKPFTGKYAVIYTERLFSESDSAKSKQTILQNEFSQRQNDLRDEAARSPNPSLDSGLITKQKDYVEDLNRRDLEERTKLASEANIWLKKIAEKEGISIISEKITIAYVKPSFDITKESIALMNGQKTINDITLYAPKEVTVAALNADKIFSSAGLSPATSSNLPLRDKLAVKANTFIKRIAEANNIDIIYIDPAYVTPSSDITTKVIELLGGMNQTQDLLVNGFIAAQSLAAVNTQRIVNTHTKKDRVKLAEAANIAIVKFAEKNQINLVLADVAYIAPSFDVTDQILALTIPPKEDAVAQLPPKNPIAATSPSKSNFIDVVKGKCKDLGFKLGTEDFGKCVLQLSK
jgi:outer membrane protein